jgi:hypothetical protein
MEPAAKLILWMAGRTNRQRMLLDAQQQPLAPLCA